MKSAIPNALNEPNAAISANCGSCSTRKPNQNSNGSTIATRSARCKIERSGSRRRWLKDESTALSMPVAARAVQTLLADVTDNGAAHEPCHAIVELAGKGMRFPNVDLHSAGNLQEMTVHRA
jgi:hypothetical protein